MVEVVTQTVEVKQQKKRQERAGPPTAPSRVCPPVTNFLSLRKARTQAVTVLYFPHVNWLRTPSQPTVVLDTQ